MPLPVWHFQTTRVTSFVASQAISKAVKSTVCCFAAKQSCRLIVIIILVCQLTFSFCDLFWIHLLSRWTDMGFLPRRRTIIILRTDLAPQAWTESRPSDKTETPILLHHLVASQSTSCFQWAKRCLHAEIYQLERNTVMLEAVEFHLRPNRPERCPFPVWDLVRDVKVQFLQSYLELRLNILELPICNRMRCQLLDCPDQACQAEEKIIANFQIKPFIVIVRKRLSTFWLQMTIQIKYPKTFFDLLWVIFHEFLNFYFHSFILVSSSRMDPTLRLMLSCPKC